MVETNTVWASITFSDFAEHKLMLEGVCIITGALAENRDGNVVIPTEWFKSAKWCTCCEFVDRGEDPCTHIWLIYLEINWKISNL